MNNQHLLQIEDRIEQLVFLAQIFNDQAKLLFERYKKIRQGKNEGLVRLIVMQNVLYFHQVTLILNTILEKPNKPNEQSLAMWQKIVLNSNDKKWNELSLIQSSYLESPLHKIRNKLIAHKDYKRAGNGAISFLNPVKNEHIEKANKIIKDLENYIQKNFSDPSSNIWFEELYKPAFDKFNQFMNQEKPNKRY